MPLSLVSLMPVAAHAAPGTAAVAARAAGQASPGPDAIRFTVVQPDGQGATVYEAGRAAAGATRTITDLSPTPDGGWSVVTRETKPLALETFDYMRGLIDAALAQNAAPVACPAGPDYLAERGERAVAGCGTEGKVPAIARALGVADAVSP